MAEAAGAAAAPVQVPTQRSRDHGYRSSPFKRKEGYVADPHAPISRSTRKIGVVRSGKRARNPLMQV
eukprot:scaffold258724_cov25-Prasinocladus_malaysianus.AAC.1